LIYARNATLPLNIKLIWLTLYCIMDKRSALKSLQQLLARYGANKQVLSVALRETPLVHYCA
jgi:hypothetical protein